MIERYMALSENGIYYTHQIASLCGHTLIVQQSNLCVSLRLYKPISTFSSRVKSETNFAKDHYVTTNGLVGLDLCNAIFHHFPTIKYMVVSYEYALPYGLTLIYKANLC